LNIAHRRHQQGRVRLQGESAYGGGLRFINFLFAQQGMDQPNLRRHNLWICLYDGLKLCRRFREPAGSVEHVGAAHVGILRGRFRGFREGTNREPQHRRNNHSGEKTSGHREKFLKLSRVARSQDAAKFFHNPPSRNQS
jgi:hypothetical protein